MEERHFSFKAMGSIDEIHLYSSSGDQTNNACLSAIDTILALEKKYSRFQSDTIVSRINANAGKERVPLDSETMALLSYADTCYQKSAGLFDITSGVTRAVWDFKQGIIPTESQLSRIKKLIGWSKISIDKDGIFLPHEEMEIDLGGIVKEYAADKAASVLRENKISNAFINLGGDIHITGPRPDGRPWRIGISHPRKPDATIASISLSQGALATSGDYERFFEKNGKRYCHIINPKTGWPVQELQSVTVCADSCLVAGSLSTMSMLLGKKRGLQLLNNSGVYYMVIDASGETTSKGPFQKPVSPGR